VIVFNAYASGISAPPLKHDAPLIPIDGMVLKVEEALYYGSDAIFARLLTSAHRGVQ
jgi:hypothetical protein